MDSGGGVTSSRSMGRSIFYLNGGSKKRRSGIDKIKAFEKWPRCTWMKAPALRFLCVSFVIHIVMSEALAFAGKDLPAALIVANAVIFAMWQFIDTEFMEKHFLASSRVTDLVERPHTVVLNAFSHAELDHFSANMCSLWAFSEPAMAIIGPRGFARLYSAGCVLSTLFPAYVRHYQKYLSRIRGHRGLQQGSTRGHGASGAICAVIAWVCLTCPSTPMKFDLPVGKDGSVKFPAPLALCGLLWLCRDIQGASGKSEEAGNIGYGAHVGGAIAGVLVYCLSGVLGLCNSAALKHVVAALRGTGDALRMGLFTPIPDRMLQSELAARQRRRGRGGGHGHGRGRGRG